MYDECDAPQYECDMMPMDEEPYIGGGGGGGGGGDCEEDCDNPFGGNYYAAK